MFRALAAAVMATALAGCSATPPAGDLRVAEANRFTSDRISVRVVGQGPDVVLIPGLSSSPRAWTSTTAAVPGYRYHLVQLKGFGGLPAETTDGGPVAAPAAEEIARYIETTGLKQPTLVGHSMGGTMAMMVSARHPERVGRLMVVDMLPFLGAMFGGSAATPESVRPIADQIRTGMMASTGAARDAQIRQTMAGMVRTESLRAEPIEDSLASDPGVSARAFHELVVTNLQPELSRITAPTTVLYVLPTGSPLNEAQIDAAYRGAYATLPGAQLKRIPESAHFIMFDQPQRFQQELRGFLANPG